MPAALILELLKFALPLIAQIRSDWKATHGGVEPTDAEVAATFQSNIDLYLAEGASWRAAHPHP